MGPLLGGALAVAFYNYYLDRLDLIPAKSQVGPLNPELEQKPEKDRLDVRTDTCSSEFFCMLASPFLCIHVDTINN